MIAAIRPTKASTPNRNVEAGEAEERGGRHVVARDRPAVLEAGDAAPGGVEVRGGARALGGPVGDAERDGEDDAEDRERQDLEVGGEDDHRAPPRSRARRPRRRAARAARSRGRPCAGRRTSAPRSAAPGMMRGEPREREPVDDLPAHHAGREGRQQQVADARRRGTRSSPAPGSAAARAPAPGTRASARRPASRRTAPPTADPCARTAWSRTCCNSPLSTRTPLRVGVARSARLGHLRRLLGDHRPVARRVGDALLEPRVAAVEHLHARPCSWRRRRWPTARRTARRRGARACAQNRSASSTRLRRRAPGARSRSCSA